MVEWVKINVTQANCDCNQITVKKSNLFGVQPIKYISETQTINKFKVLTDLSKRHKRDYGHELHVGRLRAVSNTAPLH